MIKRIRRFRCGRKVRHDTLLAALTVKALMLRRLGFKGGELLRAYSCPKCYGWHLGRTDKVVTPYVGPPAQFQPYRYT